MGSSDELRRLLDELGVEYTTYDTTAYEAVIWTGSVCKWIALPSEYGLAVAVYKDYLTPEQVIAATVSNVGSANTEEVLRQLVARLGDAADFHFASKYVDCIVKEYAGKLATAGMTEEEADSRALMEAIRDDDGVRYSMDEVMDLTRKDAETLGMFPMLDELGVTLAKISDWRYGHELSDEDAKELDGLVADADSICLKMSKAVVSHIRHQETGKGT